MKYKQSGFTLIEMLTVLAIIGVLCGLLFGALGAVREKGRQRVCGSNLHQWGLAFAMYAQDNDGMEAQLGVAMTHAQLGLPPALSETLFMKQYGLTAVQTCPSAHYASANGINSYHTISYIIPGFLDDSSIPDYPQVIALLGPNYALAVCEMHNVDVNFDDQPTWATKWVQSVHISQQLQFHQVPVRTSTPAE